MHFADLSKLRCISDAATTTRYCGADRNLALKNQTSIDFHGCDTIIQTRFLTYEHVAVVLHQTNAWGIFIVMDEIPAYLCLFAKHMHVA